MSRVKPLTKIIFFLLLNLSGTLLFAQTFDDNTKQEPLEETKDSVVVIGGANYKSGPIRRLLAGKHYRKAWITPVKVPVLKMNLEKGGLKPLKEGGNMQSLVLHVKAGNNKKYVLRSIQKTPARLLPDALKNNKIIFNVVQDQVSTLHPYGAFVIAPMAKSVGVYHTNPKLVYIRDEKALGEFKDKFAGMLALLEEKPEDDLFKDSPLFGFSGNIVKTEDLLEALEKSSSNVVDQRAFARARLFDMIIGDWDRSEDQWAWAGFTNNGVTMFQPIPRDRDQVFVKMDGLIPWVSSRKWGSMRKIQGFKEEVTDLKGLNLNGRSIDRTFLTTLTEKDWQDIATSMQAHLTDEVIESAIGKWPKEIYELDGKAVISKLKKRRDKLGALASEYYKVLAAQVNVVGSDEQEYFEVQRMDNHVTRVAVYKSDKVNAKKDLLYERSFSASESDEIRLYGLGGDDKFVFTGSGTSKILARVIGGDGKDSILESSEKVNRDNKVVVYDIVRETYMNKSKNIKSLCTYDIRVNDYDRDDFMYDMVAPKVLVDYNSNDGLFLGGGLSYTHFSFRKKPYSYLQKIVASSSLRTEAYYIRYDAEYLKLIRNWGLKYTAFMAPYFASAYYGLGNNTVKTSDDNEFHLLRLSQLSLNTYFERKVNDDLTFLIGPGYHGYKAKKVANTFIESPAAGLINSDFERQHYGSLNVSYRYKKVDSEISPRKGKVAEISGSWNVGLENGNQNFSRISAEYKWYIPFHILFDGVIALRAGAASNFGDFPFYEANFLGGYTVQEQAGNLRGFSRNRFAGRSKTFQNTEMRLKLFHVSTILVNGDAGIIGFYDSGRVWADNESSNKWHHGYGPGVWIVPFDRIAISAMYSISKDDKLVLLNMGFFF